MSKTYTIKYSLEAINDLRNIYSYIAFNLGAPVTATQMINHLRTAIKKLDFMPMRYPCADTKHCKLINIHKMIIDNYYVFYIVNNELSSIDIVRIVYGKRDIAEILND